MNSFLYAFFPLWIYSLLPTDKDDIVSFIGFVFKTEIEKGKEKCGGVSLLRKLSRINLQYALIGLR